jgi:exodeoxyribonuclease V alpha subunit
MCDLELARDLFAAIETNMRVVLVGDIDQLPSVGAGSVLRDMIGSGEIPTTRLKYNFRQANGSIIAKKANEIASGEIPKLKSEGDFDFEKIIDDDQAAERIIDIVKDLNENGKTPMDYQVLSPMYKSDSGVDNMNETIREIVNPVSKYKDYSAKFELGKYRLGDKVMVVKNDYDKMVFNGNLGKVVKIDGNKMFVVITDNEDPEPVIFTVDEFNLLKLAYATTIHKSQGSEFPIVIMSLTKSHYIMLKRNLLYTGMTRAKDRLILVGNTWAVRKAIKNNKVEKRYSKLGERIRK